MHKGLIRTTETSLPDIVSPSLTASLMQLIVIPQICSIFFFLSSIHFFNKKNWIMERFLNSRLIKIQTLNAGKKKKKQSFQIFPFSPWGYSPSVTASMLGEKICLNWTCGFISGFFKLLQTCFINISFCLIKHVTEQ